MGKLKSDSGEINENRGNKNHNRSSLKSKKRMKPKGPKTTKKLNHALSSVKYKKSMTITKHSSSTSNASEYLKCFNPAFSNFLRQFQKSSSIHNEMLAILSAIDEVIKKDGGTQSSDGFYQVLMTTLEQAETDQSILATLSLLEMLLPTVSNESVQNQFNKVSKIFYEILQKYSTIDLIIRHCIECLSVLLQAQDNKTWSDDLTMKICDEILELSVHAKPKIRKKAQHAIIMIINNFKRNKDNSIIYHPAACQIAINCLSALKNADIQSNITKTLHLLSLLKDIIEHFPKKIVELIANELRKIMEIKNTMLTLYCLQTLDKLSTTATAAPSFGTQVINNLYECQPKVADSEATLAWLTALQQAQCNLTIDDCSVNLLQTLKKIMELWRSDNEEIVEASSKSVVILVQKGLGPMCIDGATTKKYRGVLRDVIQSAQGGIRSKKVPQSVRYHSLIFIKALFEVAGGTCAKEMSAYLPRLVDLHAEAKSVHKNLVESTIGSAVKSLGPELVLSKIPLQNSAMEFNQELIWLLDVLKTSIESSSLSYFRDEILPLAIICAEKSNKLERKNDEIGVKNFKLLYNKIWNLLPAFCNNPNDVESNFKSIAKILGVAFKDREELRMTVINSLKNLITTSVEKNKKNNIEELAKYADDFLPSLINLYTINSTNEVLHVIKIYLSITPEDIVGKILSNLIKKFNESNPGDLINEALFNLIKFLTNIIDKSKLNELYDLCLSMIENNENAYNQEKGYKILEEILTSESEICHEFYQTNRIKIQTMFIKATESVLDQSRESRLHCLRRLIQSHPKLERTTFLKSIIPEIVMFTNEDDKKFQTLSYQLLNEIADKFSSNNQFFIEYIDMLIAGLGSEQDYIASSLLGLAGIILEYHELIGDFKLKEIVNYSSQLILGVSREIAATGLSLLKVLVTSLLTESLRPLLETIMKGLTGMTNDCKRHCRKIILEIITKLIKKFNFNTISHLVPTSDELTQSRLRNIKITEGNKFANKAKQPSNGNTSSLKGKTRTNGFCFDNNDTTACKLNFKPLKRSSLTKKKKAKNVRGLEQNRVS